MSGFISNCNNNRLIYIFGNSGNKMLQQQQKLLLNREAGIKERDIVIRLVEKADQDLYTKYKVSQSANFTLLLIGKDGGVKLRTESLLQPDSLFAVIDAMPMRQAEMNRGNE